CELLAAENDALAVHSPDFRSSIVRRLSFWKCPAGSSLDTNDFLGYAIFKQDFYSADPYPECHVYECVLPHTRGNSENNFIRCTRDYNVTTNLGRHSVRGILYAQQ